MKNNNNKNILLKKKNNTIIKRNENHKDNTLFEVEVKNNKIMFSNLQ